MRRIFCIAVLVCSVLLSCNDGNEWHEEDPPEYEFDKVAVLEYKPAPGQFINDKYVPSDAADAARWAQEALAKNSYVSLGAFGGYIIIKPSRAVENVDGYDFGIAGNPITTHNEPGIVWVSRDENGNGIADDPWYELRGSETGTRNYSVTYYRTDEPGDVRWTGPDGEEGVVSHISAHTQNYYPLWCDIEGSFTLTGTLLEARPGEENGQFRHDAYGWGYADNLGSDIYANDNGRYVFNRFDIANATDAGGESVSLDKIDFIKVQSAIICNLGHLGEVSTEVTGLVLLN